MAHEIIIQGSLTLQRYSPALQGVGNLTISQTGTKCVSNVITLATGSSTAIQIEGTTSLTYLFVKNMDAAAWDIAKFADVSLDSSNVNVIARLRAGEFCLIPVKPAAIFYARSTGGTPDICYIAACA